MIAISCLPALLIEGGCAVIMQGRKSAHKAEGSCNAMRWNVCRLQSHKLVASVTLKSIEDAHHQKLLDYVEYYTQL